VTANNSDIWNFNTPRPAGSKPRPIIRHEASIELMYAANHHNMSLEEFCSHVGSDKWISHLDGRPSQAYLIALYRVACRESEVANA